MGLDDGHGVRHVVRRSGSRARCAALGRPRRSHARFLLILAAVIVVGTCVAYMLYLQGINDCGPVKAGLLCAAEPVSAMVLSVLWLHSSVSTWDVAGCACILVMIVMVTELEPKREGEGSDAELAGVETASLPEIRRSSPVVRRCLGITIADLQPWPISNA